MQEITYLSGDVTEEIFRQLAESPQELTNPHANILFQTVLKGRISAPESCYRTFLWLIRRMPQMLSGNELHPGYVFQDAPQRTFDCCPVCKSPDCTPFHTAFSYAMVNFQEPFLPVKLWMKCEHCGNLHTFQFPESFLALSEHQELIQPSGICPDCISPTASGSVLSIWSEVLNLLRQYTDGTSVLEVGIGNGDFLSVALEMGYEPDAVEIEPERAQNVADILQLPVYCCDFLRFDTEKRYDILMMGDVIEHVTEPEQALLKAHRLLRENGVLWLSTPNFNSSFSRLRKFEDAMWKEPYHISYFSYETLLSLLQKCGFQVLHYKVSNRYNGSMELVLGK